MTRELRRRHRIAAVALALSLPPAYGLALAARTPVPVVRAPLAATLGEPAVDGASVAFDTRAQPAQPDALVYACARAPESDVLAPDCVFLGELPDDGVRRFALPAVGGSTGVVAVWSGAWRKLLSVRPLARAETP